MRRPVKTRGESQRIAASSGTILQLIKNVGSLSVVQLSSYVIPLITLPYILRTLGPAHYGRVAFAQSLVTYFTVITAYSFDFSGSRQIASCTGNTDKISEIASGVIGARIMLACVSLIGLTAITAVIPVLRRDWLLFAVLAPTLIGTALSGTWLFQGTERLEYSAGIALGTRLVGVALMFAVVRSQGDYLAYAGIQSLSAIVSALLELRVACRVLSLRFLHTSLRRIREELRDGWNVFLGIGVTPLYVASTPLVLGFVSGPEAVGLFSAAKRIIDAVLAIYNPVFTSMYPRMVSGLGRRRSETWRLLKKIAILMAGSSAAAAVVILWQRSLLVSILGGRDFSAGSTVLGMLAPLVPVITSSKLLGSLFLLPLGDDRAFGRTMLIPALIHPGLLILLTMAFGVAGSCIAVVGTEVSILVLRVVNVVSHHRSEYQEMMG